jgi:hypothetical protein
LAYRNDSLIYNPFPIGSTIKRKQIIEKRHVNGNVVWQKKYETFCPNNINCNYDFIYSISLTKENCLLSNRFGNQAASNLIEKFDSNGNLLFTINPSILYTSPVVTGAPTFSEIELKDSSYLLIGQVNDTFTVNKPYYRGILLKYSKTGLLLDSVSIYNQATNTLVETSKGDFLLNVFPYIPGMPTPTVGTYGILHLNANFQFKNYHPVCFGQADMYTGALSANNQGGAFFCTSRPYSNPYIMVSFDSLLNTYPNVLSGHLTLDNDKNCIANNQDYSIWGGLVSASDANNQTYIALSNLAGDYRLSVPNGTYILNHTPTTNKVNACNTSSTSFIANATIQTKNYFDTLIPNINDFEVTGFLSSRKPADTTWLRLYYQNSGTTLLNGTLKIIKDTSFNYLYSSPLISSIQNDTILYSITNLKPDSSGSVFIQFCIKSSLQIGSNIRVVYSYNLPNDISPWNNFDTIAVKASNLSPKAVSSGFRNNSLQVNKPLLIDGNEYLTYRVNFQNSTGKTINKLVILDSLDADLDMTTFKIVKSSHPYKEIKLIKNILQVYYEGMNLKDSANFTNQSIGEFIFAVKPKNNLVPNTLIKNKAILLFDVYPQKVTNSVLNKIKGYTVGLNKVESRKQDELIQVYPNPAKNKVKLIASLTNIRKIALYSIDGKEIYSIVNLKTNEQELDISGLLAGIYLIKVESEKGVDVKKIIVLQD